MSKHNFTCGVCHSPLQVSEFDGRRFVSHPPYHSEDHEPVPVMDQDELVDHAAMVCDICLDPAPKWGFPTQMRSETLQYGSLAFTNRDDMGWAACDACAVLIESRDLKGLLDRALDSPLLVATIADFPDQHAVRRDVRSMLADQYVGFLNAIVGEKTPL
jgi:hypothetical protein